MKRSLLCALSCLALLSCDQPNAVVPPGFQLVWSAPPPDTLREGAAVTVGAHVRDPNGVVTTFNGVPLDLRFRFETDSQPGTSCGAACTTTVAQGQAQVTINWVSAGRWTARACARPPNADSLCVERGLVVPAVHAALVMFPADSVTRNVRFPVEARLRLLNGAAVTDLAPQVRLRFTGAGAVHCPEVGAQCVRPTTAGVARLDSITVLDTGTVSVIACAIAPNAHERCDPAGARTFRVVPPPAPQLAQLAFITPPANIVAGDLLPDVVIELRDAQGQRLTGATDSIFVFAQDGSQDFLVGTTARAAVDGRVTFDDLMLTHAGTLTFTARHRRLATPPLLQITQTFVVSPDVATASIAAISALNQSGPVGTPVADLPAVRIRDVLGNAIPGLTVTFSVLSGTGTISDSVRLTDGSGVARLGGWILGAFSGTTTVQANALGIGMVSFTATAVATSFHALSISAGNDFTCAASVAQLPYCWGENGYGQLGDGTSNGRNRPNLLAAGLIDMVQVSTGLRFACGRTPAGAGYCWGNNEAGQLGRGNRDSSWTPAAVAGGHTFTQIVAGADFACGLDGGGAAWCWGDNALGDPTPADQTIPGAVTGLHEFTQIVAGAWHACGLTSGGEVWCWGRNDYGQVGDSTTFPYRWIPVRVVGGRTFTKLAAGVIHTCGISAGAVYCWGQDGGQLGTGVKTFTPQPAPVPALGALGITQQIAAGGGHTCSLNSAGEAYCWGNNNHGQLGDGTTTERLSGVAVLNAPAFSTISVGQEHTCATRPNGESYCWGWNYLGRLGVGNFLAIDAKTPVPVAIP